MATDANVCIIYYTDGGQLYYDADSNGAEAAVQFTSLSTGLPFTFNDFDIV